MVREGDLIDGWLLQIHTLRGGIALEAVEAGTIGSFAEYRDRRSSKDLDTSRWEIDGTVSIESIDGHGLSMVYDGENSVDGVVVDYESYPLLEAPWVKAPLGSGKVRIEREQEILELDFGVDADSPLIPMRVIG